MFLVLMQRRYGALTIIHPAFVFGLGWLVSLLAYLTLGIEGTFEVYDNDALLEIAAFTMVVCGAFYAATSFGIRRRGSGTQEALEDSNALTLVWVFSIVSVLAAVTNWIALGGNLSLVEERRQIWLRGIPTITARLWYPFILCFPVALVAGWRLVHSMFQGQTQKAHNRLVLGLPLVAGVFWYLGTGGRHTLMTIVSYFGFGICCGVASVVRSRKVAGVLIFRRIAVVIGSLLFLVVGVMGVTSKFRHEYYAKSEQSGSSIPFSAAFSYAGIGIATYQADKSWREDGSQMGSLTFGVLRLLRIDPLLGWKALVGDDEIAEERNKSGLEFAFSWATTLGTLVEDFGFVGALVTCCGLVIVAQLCFMAWVRRKTHSYLLGYVPLLAMFKFWGEFPLFSFFKSNEVVWIVVSFAW